MANGLRILLAALFCLGGCSPSKPSVSKNPSPPVTHKEDGIVTLGEARAGQPDGVIDRRRTSEPLPTIEGLQADEYPAPLGDNAVLWSGCEGETTKAPALLIAIDPFERLQEGDPSWENGYSRELAARAVAEQGLVVVLPTYRGMYKNKGYDEFMWGEVEDLNAAIAWTKKLPCVDPTRVHLAGYRFGGTLALLSLAWKNVRVASATTYMAWLDLVELHRQSQSGWTSVDLKNRDALKLRSPVNFLAGIKTPTTLLGLAGGGAAYQAEVALPMVGGSHLSMRYIGSAPEFEYLDPLVQDVMVVHAQTGQPIASHGELRGRFEDVLGHGSFELAPFEGPLLANCLETGLSNPDTCHAFLSGALNGYGRDSVHLWTPLQRACDQGNTTGCAVLAIGRATVLEDPRGGAAQLAQMCDQGSLEACAWLGSEVTRGYLDWEEQGTTAALETACEGEIGYGCYVLGHRRALATDDDALARARVAYERGCRFGEGRACDDLGVMFHRGRGVPASSEISYQFYQRGCDLGHAHSCANAGFRVLAGQGTARDVNKGGQMLEKSCGDGSPWGCFLLGREILEGNLSDSHRFDATRLIFTACLHGGEGIACHYGLDLVEEGRATIPPGVDASRLYLIAAENYASRCHRDGIGRDCRWLAELYEEGLIPNDSGVDIGALREKACALDPTECE